MLTEAAACLNTLGQYKRAQQMAAAAIALSPGLAAAWHQKGYAHHVSTELDAARERFERAIQIDDEEIDAHYQLGRIARAQKRFGDAIKNFEQVVARDR